MRNVLFRPCVGPPPLRVSTERVVRFEDCDPLGIMWHGRYPSFLEDAREALGDSYGIGYLDFYGHGVALPIKSLCLDYIQPLRYRSSYAVHALLYWTEAARINIEYEILDMTDVANPAGRVMTRAWSVQLMTSLEGSLLLEVPAFYRAFLQRWERGELLSPPDGAAKDSVPIGDAAKVGMTKGGRH